jgi:acyl carrier protein
MEMDNVAIAQEVRSFIAADYLLGHDGDLADSASFLEEGILDSTGVLQLIAFLERTYGIRVENEEVIPNNLDSISSVVEYVTRKLNGAATPQGCEPSAGNPGGGV